MDNIMVALVPIRTDWTSAVFPHLTVVYCGKVDDYPPSDFNKLAKDVASVAMITSPLYLQTISVEKLGPPEDLVSAITLRPTSELIGIRTLLRQWDSSDWPEYKPHITLGPYPTPPVFQVSQIAFDRIMVGWGEEQLVFWLKP